MWQCPCRESAAQRYRVSRYEAALLRRLQAWAVPAGLLDEDSGAPLLWAVQMAMAWKFRGDPSPKSEVELCRHRRAPWQQRPEEPCREVVRECL